MSAALKVRVLHAGPPRDEIADEIQRLVDILDRLDGDADCEPSLGWTHTMATGSTADVEDAFAVPFYGAAEPRDVRP